MNNPLHLQPSRENWHHLIEEAGHIAGHDLSEDLHAYLVITLEKYLLVEEIADTVFALDYLEGLQKQGQHRAIHLRQVGDHCLLVSGLFPERLLKKTITLDHLVNIGQNAYHAVANVDQPNHDPHLFRNLSESFIGLMDVLHIAGAKRQLI